MTETIIINGRTFEIRRTVIGERIHVRAFENGSPVTEAYTVGQETTLAARENALSFDAVETLAAGVREELNRRFGAAA